MLKNFFLLNRIVNDVKSFLLGYTVVSVFSQEKDLFVFECRKNTDTIYLFFSVNPQLPYFTVRTNFHKAKKNVAELAQAFLPFTIKDISIAVIDRVIRFSSDTGVFFFFIRGNRTNVIFSNQESSSGLKKIDKETSANLLAEFNNLTYTNSLAEFIIYEELDSYAEFKKKYPFLGKEILDEAFSRTSKIPSSAIKDIIQEINNSRPAVFRREDEVVLGFETFIKYKNWTSEAFENIFEAINSYVHNLYSANKFQERKKSVTSSLEKELERTASRINNLKNRIDSGSKEEEYKTIADLLLINANKIQRGDEEITVDNIYNPGNEIKIKLDASLSPHKNADKYYEKSRSERINFEKSRELYNKSVQRYNFLKTELVKVQGAHSAGELKNMETKKNIPSGDDKDDLKSKFRQYIIDGKYRLFLGKDSEKNDQLTTRFAKQNDYWFHARSVSGSHVILRVENTKEPVPKPVLKKAAAIAAYHSKAKTSSLAPVSYTLKKYVVKKKGMEPGKVALLKEEVLLVKPEIPSGCEFVSGE